MATKKSPKRVPSAAATPPPQPASTSDEEHVADEVFEFVRAIDQYKRVQGRPFPTWSEVLEVLKGLGYARRGDAGASASTSDAGDRTQRS